MSTVMKLAGPREPKSRPSSSRCRPARRRRRSCSPTRRRKVPEVEQRRRGQQREHDGRTQRGSSGLPRTRPRTRHRAGPAVPRAAGAGVSYVTVMTVAFRKTQPRSGTKRRGWRAGLARTRARRAPGRGPGWRSTGWRAASGAAGERKGRTRIPNPAPGGGPPRRGRGPEGQAADGAGVRDGGEREARSHSRPDHRPARRSRTNRTA